MKEEVTAQAPYEPFKHLNTIRREFDRVFADFPANFGGEHGFAYQESCA